MEDKISTNKINFHFNMNNGTKMINIDLYTHTTNSDGLLS